MKFCSLVLTLLLAAIPAGAADFRLVDGDAVVGAVVDVSVSGEETLLDVGRRFDLGYHDMARANAGVDLWVPNDGERLTLPLQFVLPAAPRSGVVLNLPEYRLYHFQADGVVTTYPMSIGRMDWETPLGLTRVTAKAANPSWYPPASVRAEHLADGDPLPAVVPPGPDNPLGTRALRLGIPGYLIHGTNRPAGVGMRVTHGCLRLYPEDVERLYDAVPVGTRVRIVNQPVKAGFRGARLWLEVHPALAVAATDAASSAAAQSSENVAVVDAEPATAPGVDAGAVEAPATSLLTLATRALVTASADRPADVDWAAVEQAVTAASGVPVVVGTARAEPAVVAP